MTFEETVESVAKAIDAAGVAVVVGGIVVSTALVFGRGPAAGDAFRSYRRRIGRSILLGLEFLVAADIIRTVAVSPTFRGVGVLAVIVAIRTFLSMALELEIDGRWPWQARNLGRS